MSCHLKDKLRCALIDGDIAAYRAAVLVEGDGGDEIDVAEFVASVVRTWAREARCRKIIVAMSEGRGYRYDVWSDYKAHRRDVPKPELLPAARESIYRSFKTVAINGLEADDIMGILATNGKVADPVVVTIDKDLMQVPGWHYNPDKDEFPWRVTEHEADYWFCYQWLIGDSADGYKGLPGIGPVKAARLLDGLYGPDLWLSVFDSYYQAGLSFAEAMTQARLCRILRASDWDAETKSPILWSCPAYVRDRGIIPEEWFEPQSCLTS